MEDSVDPRMLSLLRNASRKMVPKAKNRSDLLGSAEKVAFRRDRGHYRGHLFPSLKSSSELKAPDLVPIVTPRHPNVESPAPTIRLTRFTGGLSAWD
jgi:hypothetical protein